MTQRALKHPFGGFAAGAATGGGLVAAYFALGAATNFSMTGGLFVPDLREALATGLLVLGPAIVIYALGLIVIGYPGWRLLEARRVRGPVSAMLFGFTAVYIVVTALTLPSGFRPWRVECLLLAISGAIVGLVIERVAYRDLKPPRPSPAPAS